MPSKLAVSRGLGTLTAGATFEQELRHVMWRRGRAALVVGVVFSAFVNVLIRFVIPRPEPLPTPYSFLVPDIYLGYIAIFAAGLLLVWWDRWSARSVGVIVLAVLIAAGLLDVVGTVVTYPDEQVFYGAGLFLFLSLIHISEPTRLC